MSDKRSKHASAEKTRLRDFLIFLIQKHNVTCYFCHKPLEAKDIPTRGVDKITEHHLDGDHLNNILSNRELSHRACHKSYHLGITRNSLSEDKRFWSQFSGED